MPDCSQAVCSRCGDINGDGIVDILDIAQVGNIINGSPEENHCCYCAADFNGDGIVNILDLSSTVNATFGGYQYDPMIDDCSQQCGTGVTGDATLSIYQIGSHNYETQYTSNLHIQSLEFGIVGYHDYYVDNYDWNDVITGDPASMWVWAQIHDETYVHTNNISYPMTRFYAYEPGLGNHSWLPPVVYPTPIFSLSTEVEPICVTGAIFIDKWGFEMNVDIGDLDCDSVIPNTPPVAIITA
jgi:hypothetical protein